MPFVGVNFTDCFSGWLRGFPPPPVPHKGEKCLISQVPLVRRLNYASGVCYWLGVHSHWQMRNL